MADVAVAYFVLVDYAANVMCLKLYTIIGVKHILHTSVAWETY